MMRLYLFWTPRHLIGLVTTFYTYLHPSPPDAELPDDVSLDRIRPYAEHDVGSGETRELVAQGANIPAMRMNAERPDERRHAPFHVDDGRAGA